MPALARAHRHRQPRRPHRAQRQWVSQFFHREVQPKDAAQAGPGASLPQVATKSLNFIAQLAGADAFGRENSIAIIKVPRVLPSRIIRLPDRLTDGPQAFVDADQRDPRPSGQLFPGRQVLAFSQFRDPRLRPRCRRDDVTNLRQALRSELTTRHYGREIRLGGQHLPARAGAVPAEPVRPAAGRALPGQRPRSTWCANTLIDLAVAPKLRFAPHEPTWPAAPTAAQPARHGLHGRARHPAAPALRVLRPGGEVLRRRSGTRGAGDQADHLPPPAPVGADGTADRTRRAATGSAGSGRG